MTISPLPQGSGDFSFVPIAEYRKPQGNLHILGAGLPMAHSGTVELRRPCGNRPCSTRRSDMTFQVEDLNIEREGVALHTRITRPEMNGTTGRKYPAVIMMHGFLGNLGYEPDSLFAELSDKLVAEGFITVRARPRRRCREPPRFRRVRQGHAALRSILLQRSGTHVHRQGSRRSAGRNRPILDRALYRGIGSILAIAMPPSPCGNGGIIGC